MGRNDLKSAEVESSAALEIEMRAHKKKEAAMAATLPWPWFGWRDRARACAAHDKARDHYLMCEDTATALRSPLQEREELRDQCIRKFGVDPLTGERVNRG